MLPDIEQWSQSSGSNVIPMRARPGLAGLRPHKNVHLSSAEATGEPRRPHASDPLSAVQPLKASSGQPGHLWRQVDTKQITLTSQDRTEAFLAPCHPTKNVLSDHRPQLGSTGVPRA